MTLIYTEGASGDFFSTPGRYFNQSGFTTGPGRGTGIGNNRYYQATALRYLVKPAEEHATFIWGASVYFTSLGSVNIMSFMSDGASIRHVELRHSPGGQLAVFNNNGTFLGATAMAVPLTVGAYRRIEVKATLSDTVGAVTVKVDEVTVLTLTNVDTKNGGGKTVFDSVETDANGQSYRFTDLYLCNAAGTTNNDFLGDIIVFTTSPNGNGSNSGLTGSDGDSVNNYLLVNDSNDATYNGSAVAGTKDTYAYSDISTAGTVLGVQVTTSALKSDAGPKTSRALVKSGATTAPQTTYTLSTSPVAYKDIVELDPNTGTAWTPTTVNNAEFGFEVVT